MTDVFVVVAGVWLILTVEMAATILVACSASAGVDLVTVSMVVFGGRVDTTVSTTVTGESSEAPFPPEPDPLPSDAPESDPPLIATTEYRGAAGSGFRARCSATGKEEDDTQKAENAKRMEAGRLERIFSNCLRRRLDDRQATALG